MGLSRNLSENYFRRSPRSGLKMTSNGKSLVAKVAGNFLPHDLDIKFGPIRVRMLQICPFWCSPRGGDGNTRIYIKGETLGQVAARIFLLTGSRLGVENLLHTTTISKEEEGPRAAAPKGRCPQGPLPPRAAAAPWLPRAAASTPGGTSPSSSSSP